MAGPVDLTTRQLEVCILAGGFSSFLSDKAIARELDISAHTAKQHMADAAARILTERPELDCGSPRRVCQAWMRQAYHAMNMRSLQKAA